MKLFEKKNTLKDLNILKEEIKDALVDTCKDISIIENVIKNLNEISKYNLDEKTKNEFNISLNKANKVLDELQITANKLRNQLHQCMKIHYNKFSNEKQFQTGVKHE